MKVLVAEDSPSMRKIVVQMLKGMGYKEVQEMPDGARAWDHISANKVDLLLTDCNMPRISGRELTQKVRGKYSSAELPIIMFTTLNSKQDILAAVKAGVNGYIVKPFNQVQLKMQLDKVLSSHNGASLEDWARKIAARNRRPSISDSFPLVICAEKMANPKLLSQLGNKEYTKLLANVVDIIDEANEEFPDMQIGYFLDSDPNNIVRQVRHHRKRLKLLMVSSDLAGGGVTLARLARINQTADHMAVTLVTHSVNEIARRDRDGLQKVGVLILERPQLDRDFLRQLFREQVVAQLHEVGTAKPTPEQIVERIETDISLMTSLPVLPMVYHRILKLSRYRNSDIQDWVDAVRTDPLSSAMIIRRANSPLYGFKTKVVDVGKAVTLLGKSTVKELIVSDALKRSFSATEDAQFKLDDYWLHSLATALIARVLTFPTARGDLDPELLKEFEQWQLSEPAVHTLDALALDRKFALAGGEDPFVGGMMHDLGKVALVHCYPGLFAGIIEVLEKAKWKAPMARAEEAVAGLNHVQVGQILAKSWGLDDSLMRVISRHHAPEEEDRYVQLIGLASFLAGAICPYPREAEFPPIAAMKAQATEEGMRLGIDLEDEEQVAAVEAFLPAGLLAQTGLELGQVLQLGMVLCPDVARLVEGIRSSMQD